MIGVALREGVEAAAVARAALEAGLVVNAPNPSTIRLLPALTISADEVALGLERLGAALDENLRSRP
jgi:acetylornithine/N-succinyldiaminopimelate aminotransferase